MLKFLIIPAVALLIASPAFAANENANLVVCKQTMKCRNIRVG